MLALEHTEDGQQDILVILVVHVSFCKFFYTFFVKLLVFWI